MLANLLGVAGVKHVITVDLHASQMQGFFKCPVDNLHAEPIIAKWIRRNVPNWKEAVVVSKNAGGTKRVTSLADALKLNFGMVTTDRKRGGNMTSSMIMRHINGAEYQPIETAAQSSNFEKRSDLQEEEEQVEATRARNSRVVADAQGSPTQVPIRTSASHSADVTPPRRSPDPSVNGEGEGEFDDRRIREVTRGRLVHGHIADDDDRTPSPARSTAGDSSHGEDPMAQSHHSSIFVPERQSLGGSGDAVASSDDEEEAFEDPKVEHMITLVGDVKNRTVFIVDDMIDKPGSWIAAAEAVVKKGRAKRVYCIATHGVFGADCLEQLQACQCIDQVVVTNSFPIDEERARNTPKLIILDLSFMLAEAIRRNHFGESLSPLFQHFGD